MSGVTLPTCESGEKMRIAFTTCDDVKSGTYNKKGMHYAPETFKM